MRRPSGPNDIPGPRFSLRGLPRPVLAALGVIAFSAIAGIVWLFVAPESRPPFLPLLGYIDRPTPTPPPTPRPVPPRRAAPPPEPSPSEQPQPQSESTPHP
jgi:hypothetical protein